MIWSLTVAYLLVDGIYGITVYMHSQQKVLSLPTQNEMV